jgi:hypothetical protein
VVTLEYLRRERNETRRGDSSFHENKIIKTSTVMTENDRQLIEKAYESTYRSTIKRLMAKAETEECREALHHLMNDPETEWED